MIKEMDDPSIAWTSDGHSSSPFSSLSSTKAFIFFTSKASVKWPRNPSRTSSPLKLTKTSYFILGELLFDMVFLSAPFSFWNNREKMKRNTQRNEDRQRNTTYSICQTKRNWVWCWIGTSPHWIFLYCEPLNMYELQSV